LLDDAREKFVPGFWKMFQVFLRAEVKKKRSPPAANNGGVRKGGKAPAGFFSYSPIIGGGGS